jgi:hypothetical protein
MFPTPDQHRCLIYSGPDSEVLLTLKVVYDALPPQGFGGIDVHADGVLIPDGSMLFGGNTAIPGPPKLFQGLGSRTFLIPRVKRIELFTNKGSVGTYTYITGEYQITAWSLAR